MVNTIEISNILFLDIETVPEERNFDDLNETWQHLWEHKARSIVKKTEEEMTPEDAAGCYNRAGIYAEFGKIVCISVGIIVRDKETGAPTVRLKSFAGTDEAALLRDFCDLLNKRFNDLYRHFLCGHNIREFDIPYICRRLVKHQIPMPHLLDIGGKKPWETKHILDTMEMWKFGDNKSYTSVKLLAAVFGFPSPKDDIDGSQVAGVFYEEGNVERIARYCEKDVVAVMNIVLYFRHADFKLSIDGEVIPIEAT